jgi:hypothetical protein
MADTELSIIRKIESQLIELDELIDAPPVAKNEDVNAIFSKTDSHHIGLDEIVEDIHVLENAFYTIQELGNNLSFEKIDLRIKEQLATIKAIRQQIVDAQAVATAWNTFHKLREAAKASAVHDDAAERKLEQASEQWTILEQGFRNKYREHPPTGAVFRKRLIRAKELMDTYKGARSELNTLLDDIKKINVHLAIIKDNSKRENERSKEVLQLKKTIAQALASADFAAEKL